MAVFCPQARRRMLSVPREPPPARRDRQERPPPTPCTPSWLSTAHGCRSPLPRLTEEHAMARGRTTALTIRLTPAQQQTLLAWQRAPTSPVGLVRRARMILLL